MAETTESTRGRASVSRGRVESERLSKLAAWVRAYLAARLREDEVDESEQLQWLCSGLEYLLGDLLHGQDGWSPGQWVDGILPAMDRITAQRDGIELYGFAVWGKGGTTQQWVDPVFAAVRLAPSSDVVEGYDVRFGDASRPLGQCPYGRRGPTGSPMPHEWRFSYLGPVAAAEMHTDNDDREGSL